LFCGFDSDSRHFVSLALCGALSLEIETQDWKINMELWNEYEGRTIDGLYPLTKLLEPEGRSAFFSTSNGTGVPTVIRLIESHFDDEEILARWRGIAALDNDNLVKLKKFGQVDLDGTSLVYAVMEPAEANLGEIVRERKLTVLETRQLASSLVGALEALHSNGFVHEHVEPGNVLAVGETIKLRSDCVREAPEGEDGAARKRKDVHDMAMVLLRALTQQRTLEAASRDLPLPEPFDQIVRKGLSGEWGLREIAALVPPPPKVVPPAPVVPSASASAPTPASAPNTAGAGVPRVVRPVASGPVAPDSGVRGSSGSGVKQPVVSASQPGRPVASSARVDRPVGSADSPVRPRNRGFAVEEERGGIDPRKIAYGVGALLVLLLVWFFVHGRSSSSKGSAEKSSAPASVAQGNASADAGSAAPASGPTVAPSEVPASRNPASNATSNPASGDTLHQWRVIAYTYNHEAQAKEKVDQIAGKHPELRPEVFRPTGRGPYLVALGGPMSRDEAFAFAGKAKRSGLPRDLYAQNYRTR
jgi:eukaryotic-like serine/threonine-protein kinase